MMRSKKVVDEDKKPVEQEVAELQRKFRVLENDKRAYSEDSQGVIRKQRASIEKLTRENRQMKQELSEVRRADRGGPEARRAGETLAKIAESKESLGKLKFRHLLTSAGSRNLTLVDSKFSSSSGFHHDRAHQ